MKKSLFLIITAIFLVSVISSCKKNNDSAEKFSTLSVEENKANVENAGIDFISMMNRMKSIESVGVIINLGDILSSAPPPAKGVQFSKDSKLFTTLETFAAAARGEKKLNAVFDAMISPKDLSSDPQSIQEFWNDNVGTYTWNPGISDFDFVAGGNKIILLFPSTDISSTNDATITISNYAGINISNPVDEDYTGDLPISLNADLKVGGTTLITYIFSASYNSDGVPNAVATDLTIENFKFEVDITNNSSEVSVNYKFLENSNVIMDLGASGLGLFTEANFDANTTQEYDHTDYIYNPQTQVWDEVEVMRDVTDFEEILHSAHAHFQLFNVALRGDINVKGLVDQLKIIKDQENDSETETNLIVAKMNEFLNLRLVNVENNEIMAKAQAYVVADVYNQYTDYWMDFRLVFNDGSPIDVATYFNAGFGDFVAELNSFITDLNSEYDLDLGTVEY